MTGINIGDGAIIAACAIVTKNVDSYTVVGGNPSRLIKKRFSDEKINELLKIRWWDLEIDVINENIDYIVSGELDKIQKTNGAREIYILRIAHNYIEGQVIAYFMV